MMKDLGELTKQKAKVYDLLRLIDEHNKIIQRLQQQVNTLIQEINLQRGEKP